MVSGEGAGIDVLDEVYIPKGKGCFRGFLVYWFQWIIVVRRQKRNVFDACVKSLRTIISTESLLNAVFKMRSVTRSKLAFTRNLLKCTSDFRKKITRRCNFAASKLSAIWHWHCGVYVSYPRLSDWTRLQWALRS